MKRVFYTFIALCTTAAAQYTPTPITQDTPAPDFKLVGVDDNTYSLADVKGDKATAIIFTTNHCPDAIASIGRMKALVEQFKSKGVGFAAINSNSPKGLHLAELGYSTVDDSFDSMKILAKEKQFNLPYLYDGDTQEVAKAYGAISTPHIFIFGPNLKLKYNGRIDDGRRKLGLAKKNEARDALTAILAGEEPAVIKTKPTGCTTKWIEKAGNVARINENWNNKPVTVDTIKAEAVSKLLENKDGSEFRLINVWGTTCGPCVLELPEFANIYRQFSLHKFEFITISLDDPENARDTERVLDILRSNHFGVHNRIQKILEKEGRTTNNYIFSGDTEDLAKALDPEWTGALPYTLLVGENGKVLYRQNGTIDPEALRKVIVTEVWRLNEE